MSLTRICVLAASLLATTNLPCQQQSLFGLLRGPAGQPVADAQVAFLPDPEPMVPALAPYLRPAKPHRTTSSANGSFRCPAPRPGMLLVTTEQGLGALQSRCWPGRAVRLELQPMAEIVVGTGSEPFRLWATTQLADGTTRHLPSIAGLRIRLPAGNYEAWFKVPEGFGRCRLELRSGHRTALQWSDEVRHLRMRPDANIHPTGFPQIDLLEGQRRVTLLGVACRASFAASWTNRAEIGLDRTLPEPQGPTSLGQDAREPLLWPPEPPSHGTPLVMQVAGLANAERPRAWLLERRDRGDFRVIGRGIADKLGQIQLPVQPDDARHWLLLNASQRALVAAPVSSPLWQSEVTLPTGRQIRCRVLDPDGTPAAFVTVNFQVPEGPILARTQTDERGLTEFAPLAGPGILTTEHDQFVSATLQLTADESAVEMRLQRGLTITGTVTAPNGQPAAGVAITLRDPGGQLRPAERVALTNAAGEFRFSGLPTDHIVLLSAQRLRGGQTWSVQAHARTGEQDLLLQLRHEDPQLQPPNIR